MGKRFLSLILTAIMMFLQIPPVSAAAAETNGSNPGFEEANQQTDDLIINDQPGAIEQTFGSVYGPMLFAATEPHSKICDWTAEEKALFVKLLNNIHKNVNKTNPELNLDESVEWGEDLVHVSKVKLQFQYDEYTSKGEQYHPHIYRNRPHPYDTLKPKMSGHFLDPQGHVIGEEEPPYFYLENENYIISTQSIVPDASSIYDLITGYITEKNNPNNNVGHATALLGASRIGSAYHLCNSANPSFPYMYHEINSYEGTNIHRSVNNDPALTAVAQTFYHDLDKVKELLKDPDLSSTAPADYSQLEAEMKKIPSAADREKLYTDDSLKMLKRLDGKLESVPKDLKQNEQDFLDSFTLSVKKVLSSLEYKPADYSDVYDALNKAPKDLSLYTEASAGFYNAIVSSIDYTKNITQQKDVDNYAIAIEAAINDLEYKPADYSKVDAALSSIPTGDDWNILTDASKAAITAAKDAVDRTKNITEQEIVDGYADAIKDALSKIDYIPADYSRVVKAQNDAAKKDLTLYTKDTVDALKDALSKVVTGKKANQQDLVDGYADAINKALGELEYKPADYSAVQTAIDSIPADLSIYTEATVNAVNAAKDAVVYGKNITEQDTVNGYATAISNAVKALEVKPADYSAVQTAIDSIPADLSIYTTATVNAVNAAKNAVVYGKNITEQDTVNGYATAINNAVKALKVKPADYSAVQTAIDSIPADLSIYTEETVNAVNAAKDAVVYGKNITEQDTVNGYATAINNAVKALKVKPADYSKVDEALAKIPEDLSKLTPEAKKAITDARDAVVRGKNITEQAIVDGYAKAINDALKKLDYVPADYKKVIDAKNTIPKDLSLYTKETVDALNAALAAVVPGKKANEQDIVDGYAKAINDAVKALKIKPADYSKVDEALAKIPADMSKFTPEARNAIIAARDAVVRDKNITEQAVVDGYAKAINDALAKIDYVAADYSAVVKAQNSVPADLSLYTDETANAVKTALANVVTGKKANEQAVVDGYAKAINDAVSKLEYKPADYSKVENALTKIPADLSIYTEETVKAVNTAKDAVVYGKKINEQDLVNSYADAIEKAVKDLAKKSADYSKVDAAIASVPKDLSICTKETADAVKVAVDAVVYGKKIDEQAMVDSYADAINDAVSKLEYKPADYSKVEAALKTIPADLTIYTEETVKAVTDAKDAVITGKKANEQDLVDAYAKAINDAVKALKIKPADYSKVDEALKTVPEDLLVYTDETAEKVSKAVKAVDRNKNITEQADVDQYAADIEKAVKGLKKKGESSLSFPTSNTVLSKENAVLTSPLLKNTDSDSIKVFIDGTAIAPENYTIDKKNGTITISKDLMKSFAAGTHDLRISTPTEIASAKFEIEKTPEVIPSVTPDGKPSVVPTQKPSVVPTQKPAVVPTQKPSSKPGVATGDTAQTGAFLSLFFLSLAAVVYAKKKNELKK